MENDIINQIKCKLSAQNILNILDQQLELNGVSNTVEHHITFFVNQLDPINKIQIILNGLKKNINVNSHTLNYESIDTVCGDILIGMIAH